MSALSRSRSWIVWGAVAMAALAALALAVTLLSAARAYTSASATVVRGEGELLVAEVETDLTPSPSSMSEDELAAILAKRRSEGLRYIAVVDESGQVSRETGDAKLGSAPPGEWDLRIEGKRARVSARIPPPKGPPGPPPGPPPGAPPGPPPPGFGDHGPHDGPMHRPRPPFLVIELEPPLAERLHGEFTRTAIVGSLAGVVLVGFAMGWLRNVLKLGAFERQAEREKRLVALGRMASVMAHELKNPLTSLKGHAQLLAEELADEHAPNEEALAARAKARADRVVAEAERLESLTKNLLEFVRDGSIDARPVEPRDLVADALADLPQGKVAIDLERAPRRMIADRARIARAVHNLVENAIQASPDGSPVEVSVAAAGADVEISVRDHGEGLTSGNEAQIFEPFVTTRVRGTGLGLPIARRIAEQHDGTLTGETHASGGAVFRMRLPRAARAR